MPDEVEISRLEELFPGLRTGAWEISSPADKKYNCIAYAAGDSTRWWWPGFPGDVYWPPRALQSLDIRSFVDAYGTIGFERCDDDSLESGFEKIALFVDGEGLPTHAARQLPDGRWTSKLGKLQDIVHELTELEGREYGKITCFLKRTRTS